MGQNQRQECHEEYDVIVDTTWVRSVRKLSPHIVRNSTPRFTTAPRLLVMILTRFMEVTPMVITKEMLKLVTKVTHLDLIARTMWTISATRFLSNMRERFQERSARPLLIPPTLRSVRKSLSLSARSTTRRFTTAHRLLIIILMDMDIIKGIESLNCNQLLSTSVPQKSYIKIIEIQLIKI